MCVSPPVDVLTIQFYIYIIKKGYLFFKKDFYGKADEYNNNEKKSAALYVMYICI